METSTTKAQTHEADTEDLLQPELTNQKLCLLGYPILFCNYRGARVFQGKVIGCGELWLLQRDTLAIS